MDRSTTPYPTISGPAPLSVRFNLCQSDDVDQVYLPDGTQDPRGDTLNWEFNFGDTTTAPPSPPLFNPVTGKPQWDVDQFCRQDHVYQNPGTFTAMVAVTDKHQEDQLSRGVTALARTTQFITINALPIAPPPPGAPTIQASISGSCTYSISWTTANATSITIKNGSTLVGTFAPNGSTTVNSFSLASFFTLTATGPGGTASTVVAGALCLD
jgi:hypothetical protein